MFADVPFAVYKPHQLGGYSWVYHGLPWLTVVYLLKCDPFP